MISSKIFKMKRGSESVFGRGLQEPREQTQGTGALSGLVVRAWRGKAKFYIPTSYLESKAVARAQWSPPSLLSESQGSGDKHTGTQISPGPPATNITN